MSSPVLTEKVFNKSRTYDTTESMTMNGTLNKTAILLLLAFVGAAATWSMVNNPAYASSLPFFMYGGLFGGFILALVISFKPHLAPKLAPLYAFGEGLALGGISAMYNNQFAEIAPNIVFNAVSLTFLAALAMFFIQRTRIIKVTGRFKKIMTIALTAIFAFYFISFIAGMFGANMSFMRDSSPLSIGISVVITLVAAFSLMMDYQFIEDSSKSGAPKYMEWYGAFALMVTLVWLYLEILRLLSKLSSRD